ncbi:hypothetical protein O3Q51_18280 [Cryomorphaceae bacterium 1068]|nr:hypothetical protein [Cryomorphaceae bacterium 1068]
MNKELICKIKVFAVSLWVLFFAGILNAQESSSFTKKQEKFLSKKTITTSMMGVGDFNAFSSYLYSVNIAIIHSDNPLVGATKLQSFPNPDLKVSPRELFDEIAKQTSSVWSYDHENQYWLFSKPLPYELDLAPEWIKEVRKGYIFYKPPTAPVGMDIYFAGHVDSSETSIQALRRISEEFAKPFDPEISADSMKEVKISNQTGLFYQTDIKEKNITWRQWAVVKNGYCYVIVSAIKREDESTILPDVERMVQSFKLI